MQHPCLCDICLRARDMELDRARKAERLRLTNIAMAWTKSQHILLHAGEMKAQEMRTVKAVTNAIVRELATN